MADPYLSVYSEYFMDGRAYHGIDHINRMIKDLHWNVLPDFLMNYQKMEDIYRAIVFHDVVYNPKPQPESKSNELLSAEWYQNFCLANEETTRLPVIDMILATEHHFDGTEYKDYSINLMLDLDIMGFADDYEEFKTTQHKIDVEFYPYFDRDLVSSKRKAFLAAILKNELLKYRVVSDAEVKTKIAYSNIERLLDEWNILYGKRTA